MKVPASEMLEMLHPTKVRLYLRNTGWQEEASNQGEKIWCKAGETAQFHLSIPKREDGLFVDRMLIALSQLEKAERRSQAEIIADIQNCLSDRIKFCLSGSAVNSSLSLQASISFLSSIRTLFYWSADSYFGQKQGENADPIQHTNNYVEQLRIIQRTYNENCIFTIILPLVSDVEIESTLPLSESQHREATTHLIRRLMQIQQLKANDTEMFAISSTLRKSLNFNGVETNAIAAFETLDRLNHGKGIDITIEWSSVIAIELGMPTQIEIPSSIISLLKSGDNK